MTLIAWVHPPSLERALDELPKLLRHRGRHSASADVEPLLAICVADSPQVEPPAFDSVPVSVTESVGLSGVWTVHRVEGPAKTREALLPALAGPGAVLPVFRTDEESRLVHHELDRLKTSAPGIGEPFFQDPVTGSLAPASGASGTSGAAGP